MARGRVNVGGGGLKVNPKPVNKTFMAFENILKDDLLELSTGSAATNGRVQKANVNVENQRDPTITAGTAQAGELHTKKLDDTKAIVYFRGSSSQHPMAHVATLDPTTGTYTRGTEIVIETSICVNTGIVVLSPTKAVAIYESSGVIRARVLNISGTTITLGANVYTIGSGVDLSTVFDISATQFGIFYRAASAGQAVIATVTGDVIAFGTIQNWLSGNVLRSSFLKVSDTQFILFYGLFVSPTYYFYARVITISGTVISFGSVLTIHSQDSYFEPGIVAWLILNEEALTVWQVSGTSTVAKIFISGTTLTKGTNVSLVTSSLYVSMIERDSKSVVVSGSTTITAQVINVFGTNFMRFGKTYTGSDSNVTHKKLLGFDGISFLQVQAGNGTQITARYLKTIKYVGAIAKANASAGTNVQCAVL